jgi:hypothetical protein
VIVVVGSVQIRMKGERVDFGVDMLEIDRLNSDSGCFELDLVEREATPDPR